jgi:hypothetical protein
MLASKYADLGATPVRRSPRRLVDPSRFEQLVIEAYRPGPDGQTLSVDEARTRISGALQQLLDAPPTPARAP